MNSNITPTILTYLEDQNLYKAEAIIIDIQTLEDGRTSIILDHTIFYPQGGGQPYDQGTISSNTMVFDVQEVRFKDGIVHHIGEVREGEPHNGSVHCAINTARRILNSKEHSAGHLIGCIVEKLRPELKASKGHHFPGECHTSYEGIISEEERAEFLDEVSARVNKAIEDKTPVEVRLVEYEELEEICDIIPGYVPKDKPSRIMSIMFSDKPIVMPCGGTHVTNLSELKRVHIKKCSVKKGITKLSYECE